ncbi:MAG TPA: TIGR01777 family oxidoreductase [Tepidisphaeraceae bacterium]|jgi:hypothetical protein
MNAQRFNRILIAGGSGFLGQTLCRHLKPLCDDIIILTRGQSETKDGLRYVQWDGKTAGDWVSEMDGADGIVNLVGRTVDCRKTPENKAVILSSRIDSVTALAAGYQRCANPPPVWVQSATAHILGDTGDEILTDDTPPGTGFAPDVGTAWEKAYFSADLGQCRRVALRISFVLGRNGGALKTLARLARLGLGGTVGHGRQYISWIHEDDLAALIIKALADPTMHGTYITTAPDPQPNAVFMRELRKAVRRPWSPPAPAIAVRIASVFLRTDPELALLGRRCLPTRLTKEGFTFQHPTLGPALRDLL